MPHSRTVERDGVNDRLRVALNGVQLVGIVARSAKLCLILYRLPVGSVGFEEMTAAGYEALRGTTPPLTVRVSAGRKSGDLFAQRDGEAGGRGIGLQGIHVLRGERVCITSIV